MADDFPSGVEFGLREIEDNPFVVDAPEDKTGLAELEDLDGVGPSTVRELKDAGIREPSDLYGLSQSEIAAVDGIGPKTAAKLRQQIAQRGNRIRQRGFRDDDIEKARDFHAERSEAERRTDESFNAKTSLSYQQWQENPGQYDMPGVDTIPRERRFERTKKAAGELSEQGLLETVEASASGPRDAGVTGTAAGTRVEVKTAQDDPESTLAHELGHIADKVGGGRASLTQEIFGGISGEAESEDQEELRQQGAKLASRRRKGPQMEPEWIEERAEQRSFGGGGFDEVFADAFAELVEEPRRAKAEAPDLVRSIRREFADEKEGHFLPF